MHYIVPRQRPMAAFNTRLLDLFALMCRDGSRLNALDFSPGPGRIWTLWVPGGGNVLS